MSRSSSITRRVVDDTKDGYSEAVTALGVAQYIEAMSIELGAMAERSQLGLLRYLLEMVRLEAEALTRSPAVGSRARRES